MYYADVQLHRIGKNKNGQPEDTNKIYYQNGYLKTLKFYQNNTKMAFEFTLLRVRNELIENLIMMIL